jgi:hypothetical protein
MYGGLFKSVIEELGLEKALELHSKQGEPFGVIIGERLKEELSGKDPDMRILKSIIEPLMGSFGFTAEYQADKNSLNIIIPKCPMYAGFQMAGLDHDTITKMCAAMSKVEMDGVNRYHPTVYGKVQHKDLPEGTCIESFFIK